MSILQQPGCWTPVADKLNAWELFIREPSTRCALYFLQRSASELSVKDAFGYSLLHRACLRGDTLVAASLLHVGVCPSILNNNGIAAVHLAASRGQTVILYLLMKSGADLSQRDSKGRIAMHYAAENDQVLTIAWLLQFPQAGQPDSLDDDGVTPLHLACARGNGHALRYMLHAGRTPSGQLKWDLSIRDNCGNTCLHAAFTSPSNPESITQFHAKSNTVNLRAQNVVWSLLTSPFSSPSGFLAVSLSVIRNKHGERPFDVSKSAHSAFAITRLLWLTQTLTTRFPATLALKLVLRIYAILWILSATLPTTLSFFSFLLATQFQSPFICFLGGAVTCLVTMRQRHRLSDGTHRPNPVFLGAYCAGFFNTLYLLIFHLCPLPEHTSWYHHIYPVFLSIVPPLLSLLFLNLLITDPGYAHSDPRPSSFSPVDPGLVYVIEREATNATKQLFHFNPELAHFEFKQSIDLYCPHCKLELMPSATVTIRHCNLCNRCIKNMDHHCLFLLKCVSYTNQRRFVLFLFTILLFTGGYVLFTLHTLSISCHFLESDDYWETCFCLYSRFSPCIVLLLFNAGSFLWILLLLNEQLMRITDRKPIWRRRVKCSMCNISHWWTKLRSLFCFLFLGRRPFIAETHSNMMI